MAANTETTRGSTYKCEQDLSGVAPTTITEGQSIKNLSGITVMIETATPGSQTFSGSGSLLCYVWDYKNANESISPNAWVRMPAMDIPITTSGVARIAFEPFQVITSRAGRIMWVGSSVTTSAGTRFTVYQLGQVNGAAY